MGTAGSNTKQRKPGPYDERSVGELLFGLDILYRDNRLGGNSRTWRRQGREGEGEKDSKVAKGGV
jgi:hypothetical protein